MRGHRAAAILGILGAACGSPSTAPGAAPSVTVSPAAPALNLVMASSQVVAGLEQRVSLGLVDGRGIPVPDAELEVQLFALGSGAPSPLGPPRAVPYRGEGLAGKGVYPLQATFPAPGSYQARGRARHGAVRADLQADFTVLATDPTPAVGSSAPRTQNPTASSVSDLALIDSGRPFDDMHYISVAQALEQQHPLVVYLGAPGFCPTATCAPVLHSVQELEQSWRSRGVDFVHIETYRDGRPDAHQETSDSFKEWHLQSDPWVFVIDSAGIIRAKFEGPVTAAEIQPSLEALNRG